MKPTKALYAFSGDPITLGHMNVIERAARLFDELIVGVGMNPTKKYVFDLEERFQMAKDALARYQNVCVVAFRGMLVDYAFEHEIPVIIRGLRNSDDLNMEMLLHQIGESQKCQVETILIPASQHLSHISSSAAKAIQVEQGLVFDYVPLNVKQKLEERLSGQFIVGVTGEIGSGKSFLCNALAQRAKKAGLPVFVLDVDKLGHQILETLEEPLYCEIRDQLAMTFGSEVRNTNGFIDRKRLGRIIFSDVDKLKQFNAIIYKPLLLKLRRELYGKRGLILLDTALIVESDLLYLCNNHVVLLNVDKQVQLERLRVRGYSEEQIRQHMAGQFTHAEKQKHLQQVIDRDHYGRLRFFENSAAGEQEMGHLFEQLSNPLLNLTEKLPA